MILLKMELCHLLQMQVNPMIRIFMHAFRLEFMQICCQWDYIPIHFRYRPSAARKDMMYMRIWPPGEIAVIQIIRERAS